MKYVIVCICGKPALFKGNQFVFPEKDRRRQRLIRAYEEDMALELIERSVYYRTSIGIADHKDLYTLMPFE